MQSNSNDAHNIVFSESVNPTNTTSDHDDSTNSSVTEESFNRNHKHMQFHGKGRGLHHFRSRARQLMSASKFSAPTPQEDIFNNSFTLFSESSPNEDTLVKNAVGAAAGIDFDREKTPLSLIAEYEKVHTTCHITVCDVSKDECEIHHRLTNSNIESFLNQKRPAWSKIRWIDVRGLSFDVVRILAKTFEFHPLVVEDILHVPQRIKSDIYEGLLYISMTLIALKNSAHVSRSESLKWLVEATSFAKGVRHFDHCSTNGKDHPSADVNYNPTPLNPPKSSKKKHKQDKTLLNLASSKSLATQRHKERISVEQVSFLLLRDGTLITIFENSGEVVTQPVLRRLSNTRTLLRDSEDASFLANALIDGIIDHAMPVMSSYAADIEQQEFLCISRPVAASIPDLHLLRSELRILRQVLEPTQHLIHSLRSRAREMLHDDRYSIVSPLTRTYLSDIGDHINTVVENINALIVECTDLIDLVFNSISRSSNDSMKALTITSILILPLSFCSSIFGTNFQYISLYSNPNGFLIFWMICLGVTVLFMCIIRFLPMFTRYH